MATPFYKHEVNLWTAFPEREVGERGLFDNIWEGKSTSLFGWKEDYEFWQKDDEVIIHEKVGKEKTGRVIKAKVRWVQVGGKAWIYRGEEIDSGLASTHVAIHLKKIKKLKK